MAFKKFNWIKLVTSIILNQIFVRISFPTHKILKIIKHLHWSVKIFTDKIPLKPFCSEIYFGWDNTYRTVSDKKIWLIWHKVVKAPSLLLSLICVYCMKTYFPLYLLLLFVFILLLLLVAFLLFVYLFSSCKVASDNRKAIMSWKSFTTLKNDWKWKSGTETK